MNKNSNSAHNHFSRFRNTTYAVLPYNSLSTTLIQESRTRFLPFNRQSATTATYVYDCKMTAWCLHEPMNLEYASFPTSGNNTAAKTQVLHTWGESSVNKSPSVIRRYSHLQSHRRNEYLSNICLEERLGANDNPWERVLEGSVANSRSGYIRCSDRLSVA
jgi:hypothetical protein